MSINVKLVVTSIAEPNNVLKALSQGCIKRDFQFILIGDQDSPPNFSLEGCDFYSIEKQLKTDFSYAQNCPVKHYARKNIGYLLAIANGADIIFETDDDNYPLEKFWQIPIFQTEVKYIESTSWINVYKYFTNDNIWPRGFALECIQNPVPEYGILETKEIFCPIQQAVVNGNPDVDAICRLIMPVEQTFRNDRRIALGPKSWSPFNSQSTKWAKQAFALLYLPAYCSFRMTDIWRSFVAQRIAWENNWPILFHGPTMFQHRNPHNLIKDFEDEISGYLNNFKISTELKKLNLKSGLENIPENLWICYEKLIEISLIEARELSLLDCWINDLKTFCKSCIGDK